MKLTIEKWKMINYITYLIIFDYLIIINYITYFEEKKNLVEEKAQPMTFINRWYMKSYFLHENTRLRNHSI